MYRYLVFCLATLFLAFEPTSTTTIIPTSSAHTTTIQITSATVVPTTSSSASNSNSSSGNSTTPGISGNSTTPASSGNSTTPVPPTSSYVTSNSSLGKPTTSGISGNSTTPASSGSSATPVPPTSSYVTSNSSLGKPTTSVTSTVSPSKTSTTVVPSTSVVVQPTKSPPKTKSISLEATFVIPFKEEYSNKGSDPYKELEKNFTEVLSQPLRSMDGFIQVEIRSFRKGSVVCDFDVIFNENNSSNAEEVKGKLQEASKSGKLGGYSVKNIEIRAPTTTAAPTEFWDKVIMDYLGGTLISFIVMVAAVGLCLILLIALICTCCQYRKLKKKTHFPKDLIINNDSNWINSHDDLLMWERNLRATEVNPGTATNRPANEKRL